MTLLEVGTPVRLTPAGVRYYGGVWPHFIPVIQGGGTPGMLIVSGNRFNHEPGAAPRPYLVEWQNGEINSYREEDLEEIA